MRDARRRRPTPRPGVTPSLRESFLGHARLRGRPAAHCWRRTATMVLRQAQWHDTGSTPRRTTRGRRPRRRSTALAAAHVAPYAGDVDLPGVQPHRRRPRRASAPTATSPMAWLARVLLAARGRVARHRHGRGAAPARCAGPVQRAARARGSPPPVRGGARVDARACCRVDRWLVSACPAALLVATPRACRRGSCRGRTWSSTLGAWLRVRRSWCGCSCGRRSPWPVIAAVGGVVVLRCIVILLVALVVHGPGGYWFAFWTDPTRARSTSRSRSPLFVLGVRRGRLGARGPGRRAGRRPAWCSRPSARRSRSPGSSRPIGLERALTVWNDQMAPAAVGPRRASSASPCTSTSRPTPRGGRRSPAACSSPSACCSCWSGGACGAGGCAAPRSVRPRRRRPGRGRAAAPCGPRRPRPRARRRPARRGHRAR